MLIVFIVLIIPVASRRLWSCEARLDEGPLLSFSESIRTQSADLLSCAQHARTNKVISLQTLTNQKTLMSTCPQELTADGITLHK